MWILPAVMGWKLARQVQLSRERLLLLLPLLMQPGHDVTYFVLVVIGKDRAAWQIRVNCSPKRSAAAFVELSVVGPA